MINRPIAGKLLGAIAELANDMIGEISRRDEHPVEEYLQMLKTSPIAGAANEVLVLLGLGMWGDYTHPEPTIQDFIRKNFEQMSGSLSVSVAELLSVKAIGYACSERSIRITPTAWMLDDIQIIHPKYYSFEGSRGEGVTGIRYRGSGEDVIVPRDRLIHVINQRHLAFRNPYGVADCKRAVSAWKAWKIMINEMLVAGQRQAVPIVVGYTQPAEVPLYAADNRTPLLDADGNPVTVPATKAMLDQLESLENRSVLSTDINNRIEALQQQTDGSFFLAMLQMLQQLQLLAFLVPESVLTATGVGDSNLNTGHRATLSMSIRANVDQTKEEILERVARPLIAWNYGDRYTENLGEFKEPEIESADQVALLSALTGAVESANGGFLPRDLETINRGRELAGIPPTDKLVASMEEKAQQMAMQAAIAGAGANGNGNKPGAIAA